MKTKYLGYTVLDTGEVYNSKDYKLKTYTFKNSPTLMYSIKDEEGKYKQVNAARFIYQAFNQDKNISNLLIKSHTKNSIKLSDLYTKPRGLYGYTKYNKMQSKRNIFNRMQAYYNKNQLILARELEWVLGGTTCDKKKDN